MIGRCDLLICLSPTLLSRPEEEIAFVIAHEIAHVVLAHEEDAEDGVDEHAQVTADARAADQLAESWGFPMLASLDRYY